ncbi:Hypothetical protein R9X50_00006400 [Acrodontium crateriforme]|uniref:RRN7-type domain-containing protein n=1 Tax=Acrodontium crateriforme TaxID=150365 RepID=A0AAQ3R1T6_9PEZI|nr:Hypothetical protein R9X50_00006400 [Acrodontium crateriforme]
MSSRVKRPDPCSHEDCGSRRFHVGDDGYTYCDRGHQQQERGTVVTEDTGELIIHGRTSKRKGDSDADSSVSRVSGFSGTRALEHYLLCLQLVLRKQCRWLIDVQLLPAEIETLIRDLWAFRLQSLQPGSLTYDSDTETDGRSNSQSQLFSSQSEGEASNASQQKKRTRNETRMAPSLLETLSLIYTAMLLSRIPVTLADIHSWAGQGDLLFYRAAKAVPLQMREKLPATYQELLEPQDLGPPERLNRKTLNLLKMLSTKPGMAFPPINHPLILYRWIRALSLPIEIFAATKRLAKLLNVEFTYSLDQTTHPRLRILRYAEPRLMALIVITTKLLFPFDDKTTLRFARSLTDPSALSLDWTTWLQTHSSPTPDPSPLPFTKAISLSESDAIALSPKALDAYLDMYETTFATAQVRTHGEASRDADFRRMLFRLFPAEREEDAHLPTPAFEPSGAETRRLESVQMALHRRGIERDAPPGRRMGAAYRRFRTVRELESFCRESGTAEERFYSLAAGVAGVGVEDLVRGVFFFERRLQVLEDEARMKDRRMNNGR